MRRQANDEPINEMPLDEEAARFVDEDSIADAQFDDDAPLELADDADLRSVDRILRLLNSQPDDPFELPDSGVEHSSNSGTVTTLQAWALQPLPVETDDAERGGFLSWLFLGLGLTAFACGAGLLGWSVAMHREELWRMGIPLVIGGEGAIIFGLLGLAEAAGQRQKTTAAALDECRKRLTMMQNFALASQAVSGSKRRAA